MPVLKSKSVSSIMIIYENFCEVNGNPIINDFTKAMVSQFHNLGMITTEHHNKFINCVLTWYDINSARACLFI